MPRTWNDIDKKKKIMPQHEVDMIRQMVSTCANTYMRIAKSYMARVITSHDELVKIRDEQAESISFAGEQIIELHSEAQKVTQELDAAHKHSAALKRLSEETRQQFADLLQLDRPTKQDYSKTEIIIALDQSEQTALEQVKAEELPVDSTYSQLKAQNASMKDALEHCLLIFKSQADRGRYPLELMPFGPTVNEENPHYLGRQGWQFILTALHCPDPFK